MSHLGIVGLFIKKIYRVYSHHLIKLLEQRGYLDMRASFLEILMFLIENEGSPIKAIGVACGLKKQTMTSHLNELEKRGYIERRAGNKDKREQIVYLTEYGQKFKLNFIEVISDLEKHYLSSVSEVELERLKLSLENFYGKISESEMSSLQA
jgi:DNA-binding MarR family transcriptional regulator